MNPLEDATNDLLAEPVPSTLSPARVSSKAAAIRRRRRTGASVAAAAVVILVLFGSLAIARQRDADTVVRMAGDPPPGAPSKSRHAQRFRFVGEGDDAARQSTADRMRARYELLGYDARIESLGVDGFVLVDLARDDETDQLAAALSATGAATLLPVLSNSAQMSSCAAGELPQWDPKTGALIACFDVFAAPERSSRPPFVDPGADPLVIQATVANAQGGNEGIDAIFAPAVAAATAPVAAACRDATAGCRAGFIVLGFDGTVLARVELTPEPAANRARLSGLFSAAQARLLGAVLQTGRLPVAIERVVDEAQAPASAPEVPLPAEAVFPRAPASRPTNPVAPLPASSTVVTTSTTSVPESSTSTTTTSSVPTSTTTTNRASTTTTSTTTSTVPSTTTSQPR